MKKFKHLLMMALTITLCVGFTACGDDDDKKDEPQTGTTGDTTGGGEDDDDFGGSTSGGSLRVSGANWSFSRYYFYAEQSEDYYNEVEAAFMMQGKTNGMAFCMIWDTIVDDLSKGTIVTGDEFYVMVGSLTDDADEMEDLCTYESMSGSATVTKVTNSTCTVKFNNLRLRTYDDYSDYGFPQTVTLNGTATFRYIG